MTNQQQKNTMPALHYSHPEPDERQPLANVHAPKFPAKFNAFPDVWRVLIRDCVSRQQDLGLGDRAFAGTILSATSWNQLVNGSYPLPRSDDGVASVAKNLADLQKRGDILTREREDKAQASKALSIAERFVRRAELDDVEGALEDARTRQERGNEERVVIVTGATRAGKSWLIEKLKSKQLVQWHLKGGGASPDAFSKEDGSRRKTRYHAFLQTLGRTMKIRDLDLKTSDDLAASILQKLQGVEGVLAIEELQRFTPRCLEFFKDLLNHSKVSLLLCMLPGKFKAMARSGHEDMQQFLGRSVLHVELRVSADLVKAYAPEVWDRCPEAAKMCRLIAEEAERGGGMSLVREVCEAAVIFAPRRASVTAEHIGKALAAYRRAVPVMSRTSEQTFGRKAA